MGLAGVAAFRESLGNPLVDASFGVLDKTLFRRVADECFVRRARRGHAQSGIKKLAIRAIADVQPVLRVVQRKSLRDRFDRVRQALLATPESDLRLLRRSDVAPRANHLDRFAVPVANQVLLVDHPAVGAFLFEKSVLDRVAAFLEQVDGLCLHRGELVGMHAAPPEIRVFEVFLRLVTQPVRDVLTDEGRRKIARRLVAVDHRWCTRQQVYETVLRGDQGFAKLLARRDVAPRTDHLDRIARRIAEHLQLVADPAVAAILLTEAVFIAESLPLEETRISPENARAVRGMEATLPEIRTVQIFLTLISEQVLHLLHYHSRRVGAVFLETEDHRRRAGEQLLDAIPGRRDCFLRPLP